MPGISTVVPGTRLGCAIDIVLGEPEMVIASTPGSSQAAQGRLLGDVHESLLAAPVKRLWSTNQSSTWAQEKQLGRLLDVRVASPLAWEKQLSGLTARAVLAMPSPGSR